MKIFVCVLLTSVFLMGASLPLFCAEIPAGIPRALKEGSYTAALSMTRDWEQKAAGAEDKAMALWVEARILAVYQNDYPGADAVLSRLIKKYPKTRISRDARYEQAVLKAQLGYREDAIKTLGSFIKAFPDHPRRRSAGLLLASLKGESTFMGAGKLDKIRVLLDLTDKAIYVKGFRLYARDENTGKGLYLGDEIHLELGSDGQIRLNGTKVPQPIQVDQKHDFFYVNGKRYRGNLRVDSESGRLRVVNSLSLENYLRGVVPSEMPCSWPPEALKAQAVAARTYAVYHMSRGKYTIYDVRTDTRSQVYSVDSENPRSDAAVQATSGQILLWEGLPAFTAFHADSGGRTEAAHHVWSGTHPYLLSYLDTWTKNTPHTPWQCTLNEKAMRDRMPQLRKVGNIQEIRILGTTPSGRARELLFKGWGGEIRMPATEFRSLMGSQQIKSTNFSIRKITGIGFSFEGKGYGHGVGMSQWGAKKMAESGKTYQEILRYYYPYLRTARMVQ